MKKKEIKIHPDFGRWINNEITKEEYADSLASRVEAAMKEK